MVPLVVPEGTGCRRASGQPTTSAIRIDRHAIDALNAAADMVIVPHLADDSEPIIRTTLPSGSLVISMSGTSYEGQLAKTIVNGVLDIRQRISGSVGGDDASGG